MQSVARLGLIGFVVALIAVSGGWDARPAFACSCAPPDSPEVALEQATAVFAGRVIEVRPPPQRAMMSSADPTFIVFEVSQAWKGTDQTPFVVSTASDSATCGYNFQVGQEYIVYARPFSITKQPLDASLCSRTAPLDQAQDDLDALGPGTQPIAVAEPTAVPTPVPSPEPTPPAPPSPLLLIGLGGGALLFLGLIVLLTRLDR